MKLNYEEGTRQLYELTLGIIQGVDVFISNRKGFVGKTEDGQKTIIFLPNIYERYHGWYQRIQGFSVKLMTLRKQQEVAPEKSEEIFWNIFRLLVNEVLVARDIMESPTNDFSAEIDHVFEILKNLDDQKTVVDQIILQIKQTWKSRTEVEKIMPLVAEQGLSLLEEKALKINLYTP
jgi:hypothetical protein